MTVSQFFSALCRACLRREGLAFFAFVGAVGAGIVLIVYLFWNTQYLHLNHRDDDVAYLAYGTLLLLGITQLSLHRLLGSKQAIDLEFWKLKASISQGGDDDSDSSR